LNIWTFQENILHLSYIPSPWWTFQNQEIILIPYYPFIYLANEENSGNIK
jgi:hypothetical protein